MARVGVVGCGYLGAVHAACLAHWGFDVIGIDADADKVARLSNGSAPFFEDRLDQLLAAHTRNGHLRFSTDMSALAGCDVVFVCVGTPQLPGSHAADLSQMETAVSASLDVMAPGTLLVGKSTVPAGTAAAVARRCADAGVRLAWNPEFLREGTAVGDSLHPDRIVVGVGAADESRRDHRHELSIGQLREVYAQPAASGSQIVVTDLTTAEIVKVAANAFLAMKVSFINAVAELCDAAGGDVDAVALAMGLDERIGRQFLRAGIGYGGGCFPKDVRALAHRAGELGASSLEQMLVATDETNERTRLRAFELVTGLLPSSHPARVAVLGAAFKPGSDDLRDSPAVWLVDALRQRVPVLDITWFDPAFDAGTRIHGVTLGTDVPSVVAGADLVVVATDWEDFKTLDPRGLTPAAHRVVDVRNCLPAQTWVSAGWEVHFLGRPSRHPAAVARTGSPVVSTELYAPMNDETTPENNQPSPAQDQHDSQQDDRLEAYDLNNDGKVSTVEAARAQLGIVDARLEQIEQGGGASGKAAGVIRKVTDKLDND